MSMILPSFTPTNILLLITLLGVVVLTVLFLLGQRKIQRVFFTSLQKLHSDIQQEIKHAVAPNFINLAPNTDDFIQFAIEVWRLEQRIGKSKEALPENQQRGFENSLQKMKRYLEKYDLAIVDYTGQKFNEGLNLDVLSGKVSNEAIIVETVEPTIMYRGQVLRKAKIVLPDA